MGDIDTWEIHEAFAVSPIFFYFCRFLIVKDRDPTPHGSALHGEPQTLTFRMPLITVTNQRII